MEVLLYKAPRGTADILSEEQPYFEFIKNKAAEISRLRGYHRIDTPVFEDSGLFVRGVGQGTDIVEKEVYTFQDRGGDNMTLRPEGTAPVCRAYIEHGMNNLPQPVKVYYIAPLFRYERPQAGRFRQHNQFGCEAIGESDPALDAEMIDMLWSYLKNIGLNELILYLNSIGCTKCRPVYLEALTSYYSNHLATLCEDCKKRMIKNPLRLLDCKNERCLPLIKQSPKITDYLCEECSDHFILLKKYLDILAIPYNINHTLVRGLDYYTKTVFEIQPESGKGAQAAVGGGGRYDNLIQLLGGPPTPGIGFATGLERIVMNLKKQNIAIPPLDTPNVFAIYLGQAAKEYLLKLILELREKGVGVMQSYGNRSLKSQLRQAGTLGISYTIIVGEEELKNNSVILRNMKQGTQQSILTNDLLSVLKNSNY